MRADFGTIGRWLVSGTRHKLYTVHVVPKYYGISLNEWHSRTPPAGIAGTGAKHRVKTTVRLVPVAATGPVSEAADPSGSVVHEKGKPASFTSLGSSQDAPIL